MKYNLQAINIYSDGAISIDYRKLDDNGKYLGSVSEDSNLSEEVKKEIYASIRRIHALLNTETKKQKSISPCDYCTNSQGNTCLVRACYEYSRWENNGKAPKEVIEKVNDFHYDRW